RRSASVGCVRPNDPCTGCTAPGCRQPRPGSPWPSQRVDRGSETGVGCRTMEEPRKKRKEDRARAPCLLTFSYFSCLSWFSTIAADLLRRLLHRLKLVSATGLEKP